MVMDKEGSPAKSTMAVHGKGRPVMKVQPVNPPIVQSTNFRYENTQQLKDYRAGDKSIFIYTRYDNPTVLEVEGYLSGLENAEKALIFSSGMGAISSTIFALIKKGDEILSGDTIYGGTFQFFEEVLPKFGVKVEYFDSRRFEESDKLITGTTKVLYVESPTNPNLKLTDLDEAVRFAKKHNLISIIDNTFATPIIQNPLDYGFDIVLHSGSKYLSGSSDLVCGAAVGRSVLMEKVWNYRKLLGTNLDPSACFLLLKGIKSLSVRIEKHNENALRIAEYFENYPKINRIFYPGLRSHPQHELARKQMNGFGGMINIELKGSRKEAERFVDDLKIILNTTSLGGMESMVSIPVLTSQYGMTEEQLALAEVTPSMVRLSVGIEDVNDLINDIEQALNKI